MSRNTGRTEDPHARLFVGSLNTNEVTKPDLVNVFSKYGNVIGVSIHRSYAFIQFDKPSEAQAAQYNEDGKVIKGCRMSVKFSNVQNRSDKPKPRERSRSPFKPGNKYPESSVDSSSVGYPPNRSWGPPPPAPQPDRAGWGPSQYPAPMAPPPPSWGYPPMSWGPSAPPPASHMAPVPPPSQDYSYPPTDHRYPPTRSEQQPYVSHPDYFKKEAGKIGDASRREDTKDSSLTKTNDCEIIVMKTQLRKYAEMIEQCLKSKGMRVDMLFPTDQSSVSGIISEIASRGVLYAVVVSGQNEEHQSITVNMLHGVPEEHRNMPLSDALVMMGKDFEGARYKTSQKALVTPSVHPVSLRKLFSIIADDRELSIGEYDKCIDYLKIEREVLAQKYSFPSRSDTEAKKIAPREPSPPGSDSSMPPNQQELNQRILSMLASGSMANKSANNTTIQKAIEVLVKGKGKTAQNGSETRGYNH